VAKKVIDIPVEVDELSLLRRGWRTVEARARVTSDMWHTLALSTTFEYSEQDWSMRYKDTDWLSPVVLEISSPRLGESRYVDLLVSDPSRVRGGKVRSSTSDTIAYDLPALSASDLSLKLLSVDAADVSGRISPLPQLVRNLTVEFEEDASVLEALDIDLDVDAFVGGSEDQSEVIASIRGQATLVPYEKLVDITARRDEWRDEGEFEIRLPDIEVDVLDDTDFLLIRIEAYHGLEVSGSSDEDVPNRPAEWLDYLTTGVDELAGEPSKVIVRLVDVS
jgi:hypothetical protein